MILTGRLGTANSIPGQVMPGINEWELANAAPVVDAGPDQWVDNGSPDAVTLAGSYEDDGLSSPLDLTCLWTKVSGPGTVVFDDETDPTTDVTFSEDGQYVLRLTVSDGELSAYDDVGIDINVRHLEAAITLPMLSIAGVIRQAPELNVTGAVTLPMLSVVGRIGAANRAAGQVRLPMFQMRGVTRNGGRIYCLTSPARATSSMVVCFVGPPNRVIEWSITQGSGQMYAEVQYTDSWGRASALYIANGYSGPLTIQVTYGG